MPSNFEPTPSFLSDRLARELSQLFMKDPNITLQSCLVFSNYTHLKALQSSFVAICQTLNRTIAFPQIIVLSHKEVHPIIKHIPTPETFTQEDLFLSFQRSLNEEHKAWSLAHQLKTFQELLPLFSRFYITKSSSNPSLFWNELYQRLFKELRSQEKLLPEEAYIVKMRHFFKMIQGLIIPIQINHPDQKEQNLLALLQEEFSEKLYILNSSPIKKITRGSPLFFLQTRSLYEEACEITLIIHKSLLAHKDSKIGIVCENAQLRTLLSLELFEKFQMSPPMPSSEERNLDFVRLVAQFLIEPTRSSLSTLLYSKALDQESETLKALKKRLYSSSFFTEELSQYFPFLPPLSIETLNTFHEHQSYHENLSTLFLKKDLKPLFEQLATTHLEYQICSLKDYCETILLMLPQKEILFEEDFCHFVTLEDLPLMKYDLLILSSFNEESIPSPASYALWLSDEEAYTIGIETQQHKVQRIKNTLKEVVSQAPNVYVSRSQKEGSNQLSPSRFWFFLNTFFDAKPYPFTRTYYQDVRKEKDPDPAIPPVSIRPLTLSVSDFERLMHDPYYIYAKHCLKVRPLEIKEEDTNAVDFGVIIHKILYNFFNNPKYRDYPNTLQDIALSTFEPFLKKKALIRFSWEQKWSSIQEWILSQEREGEHLLEQKGAWSFMCEDYPITLTCIADRIDIHKKSATIIDYKTGMPPSRSQIQKMEKPQLLLEALILSKGGFLPNVTSVNGIEIWHLHGKKGGGNITRIDGNEIDLKHVEKTVRDVFKHYLTPNTPYPINKSPSFEVYGHIKRL